MTDQAIPSAAVGYTAIAVVAAMHIGAALFHHFVRRDRILVRMLTG